MTLPRLATTKSRHVPVDCSVMVSSSSAVASTGAGYRRYGDDPWRCSASERTRTTKVTTCPVRCRNGASKQASVTKTQQTRNDGMPQSLTEENPPPRATRP